MFGNIKKLFTQHTLIGFLCISVLIHISLIVTSPKIKELIKSYFPTTVVNSDPANTTIEFVLNDDSPLGMKEQFVDEKARDILDDIDEIELEPEEIEEKKEVFVDSSKLNKNEESDVETENIGENASIARDKKTNDANLNEEAFSDGKDEWLELEKGSYVVQPESKEAFVAANENETVGEGAEPQKGEEGKDEKSENEEVQENPKDENPKIEEVQNQELLDKVAKVEKSVVKNMQQLRDSESQTTDVEQVKDEKIKNEEITDEEAADDETVDGETVDEEPTDKEITDDKNIDTDGELSNNDKVAENMGKEALVEQLTAALNDLNQMEKLRDIDSEFERLIPEPVKTVQSDEQKISENNKQKQAQQKKKKKKQPNVAKLPKEKRDDALKEIYEMYEEDLNENQMAIARHRPKRKVAMSVNGKGVYNVSAPSSYKANLSNSSLEGDASFNIKKHEYAAYYKHIRDKISLYWMLYFGTDQAIKLETKDGEPIIVDFKVISSGKIINVSIAEDAGNPFLATRTQISVTKTKLDKFPAVIEEEFIDVRFNFYFF